MQIQDKIFALLFLMTMITLNAYLFRSFMQKFKGNEEKPKSQQDRIDELYGRNK